MARILICHVPKDAGLARDLGALMMGRGHFVSFDGEPDVPKEDRPQRLRQFEAVVVVWTENSAQSIGLIEIAAEAMPLNILVPVRQESLSVHELPLKFRKLNMFGPRDIDGLSKLVVRLSQAQSSLREMTARDAQPGMEPVYVRPQPAVRPAPPSTPPPAAQPQKPPLPVFVKQRVAPPPPQTEAPQAAPNPPPRSMAPGADRPSFPPKVNAKAAEPPVLPQAPEQPLPPFVTRRLTGQREAAPDEDLPRVVRSPAPQEGFQPSPRATETGRVKKSDGPHSAWQALQDELNEPVNPVIAPQPQPPPAARPHAPYGRTPLTGRVPPPHVPAPPPQQPEPPRGSPYSSLRPQPASQVSPQHVPPHVPVPPPLPSRDGLGSGSPSFSAVAMAQHLARLVEAGLLLIYIPEASWLGEPITTEVRLGREVLDEAQGDPRTAPDRITIDTISVSLISDDPGFSIERQSERTQFVGQRFQDHAGAHGRWAWLVTPHTPGDFDLIVRISALVRDRTGVPTPVALPDRRYSIAIHAREARAR